MNGQIMDYAKLKADFDQQKLLLEKQTKLSSQLQMALDLLNRNLLKVKAENEQLQQNPQVTAQLETLQTELKRKKTELLHHQQLHQGNEQKLTDLRNALRSLNATNEKLQLEQQQVKEQQAEAEQRIIQLKQEISLHETTVEQSQTHCTALEAQLAKEQQSVEQISALLTEQQQFSTQLQQQLAENEQQMEQFAQQTVRFHDEKQAYEEQLQELQSSVEALKTNLNDAQHVQQQQQEANAQLEQRVAILQTEHENTVEQVEQATSQYEQLLAESDEQLEALEQMTEQKQMFEQQYLHILEQSTEQQLQFDESLAQLKGELQFEQEEKQLLLEKVQHLKAQNEEALANVDLLQMQKQYGEKLAEQQALEIEQLKQQLELFQQQPSAELEQPIIELPKQVEEMPSVKVATVKTDAEQLQAIEAYLQQQKEKDFSSVLKQLSKDVIQHKFSYDYQLS
ncbi:hypothetical protein NSQ62_12875 [Solibacillus sp. FSL H8-0523]|uniref:hypothetical protein n=1 Tax=Solibacillus sp. FSL H8-0523 TaxID=2954511 RepID=UPI003100D2C9